MDFVTATPGIILFQYGIYSEYIRSKRGPNVEYEGVRFKTIYPRATLNIVIILIVEGLLCISLVRDHKTILSGFIAATMMLITVADKLDSDSSVTHINTVNLRYVKFIVDFIFGKRKSLRG